MFAFIFFTVLSDVGVERSIPNFCPWVSWDKFETNLFILFICRINFKIVTKVYADFQKIGQHFKLLER